MRAVSRLQLCFMLLCGVPATCRAQAPGEARHKEVLAIVGGQAIYEDDLLPVSQGQLFQLHLQEYEIKSKAVESLVDQKLLDIEAKKKGMSRERLLAEQVDASVAEPTELELQALYIVQKEQIKRSFEEIKPQLQQLLKRARLQEARQEYFRSLRRQAQVTVLLRKPKAAVSFDPARLKGSPDAPVIIVEFSDFQCPYCRSVQPTLKRLLAKYDGRVSLAFRDLPLNDIHPQAALAAQASRCAAEQGKFWEYHDLLFENPAKLNREGLSEHARNLKLEQRQFDSCLSSGKYEAQIEQDRQLGLRAGAGGTPAFLINGNALSGNLPQESFEKIIDQELAEIKDKGAAR